MAKFIAVILGQRAAEAYGLERFVLECDCASMITKVESMEADFLLLRMFTNMIKGLMNSLPCDGLFRISRSQNMVTDRLAVSALSLSQAYFWFSYMPDCIYTTISADLVL